MVIMNTTNYYILSKQEFTSLYRFGKIPLNARCLVTVDEIERTAELVFQTFLKLPYFQGDEEYLLTLISLSEDREDFIRMSSLLKIYPLTKAAKISYEMKFNPDLIFSEIPFSELFDRLNLYFEKEERLLAVDILPEILLIGVEYEKINLNNEIELFIDLKEAGKFSSDISVDYITHLLMYDRYNPFPNTDLGYFYDAGEAFAHSSGVSTFKGSGFYTFLENNKEALRNVKLSKIISIIEKEENLRGFKEKTTLNGLKQYIAAVLFFKFKNEIVNNAKLSKTDIPKICASLITNKKHNDELILAVSLLAAYFGYKTFYDDYYAMSSFAVFRKNKIVSKENSNVLMPSKLNDEQHVETIDRDTTEVTEQTISDEPPLITEIKALSKTLGCHLKGDMRKEVISATKKYDNKNIKTIAMIKEYFKENYSDYIEFNSKGLIIFRRETLGL